MGPLEHFWQKWEPVLRLKTLFRFEFDHFPSRPAFLPDAKMVSGNWRHRNREGRGPDTSLAAASGGSFRAFFTTVKHFNEQLILRNLSSLIGPIIRRIESSKRQTELQTRQIRRIIYHKPDIDNRHR